MSLRARLLLLSVSTVAVVVMVMAGLMLNTRIAAALDQTMERSSVAGKQLQVFLVRRIEDRMERLPERPKTFDATKRAWQTIVKDDEDLAAMLEQTMAQTGSIVEIGIAGEVGVILASSNPARVGQPMVAKPNLRDLAAQPPLHRLLSVLTAKSDYETRVDLATPLQKAPVFRLQILVSPVLLRDVIKPSVKEIGWVSAFALALAVAFAYVTSRQALRPLASIGTSMDRIITGEPAAEIRTAQDREVAALESKLDLIGAKVSGARQDANYQRATVSTLVRAVAHEIKNPLNAIAVRLEILRARLESQAPEAEGEIDLLCREVGRMDKVVKTFLDLGRPVKLERAKVYVAALLDDVISLVRPQAERAGITIEWLAGSVVPAIEADEGLLRQALLNVIQNGLEAMPEGGVLGVEIREQAGLCEIAVSDTGKGIPAELRDRIFEPYFSSKENGAGLGLAIVRRTVHSHGGQITVESRVGQGTTFRFLLPVSAEKVTA